LIGTIFIIDSSKGYSLLSNLLLPLVPDQNKGGFSKFPYSVTKTQWEADLQFIKNELPRHHANPFLYLNQAVFNESIDLLTQNLEQLNDQEITFEICRLVAMLKDGHSQVISIPFNIPPFVDSRLFPLRIFYFKDGIYVTDGGRDNAELLGYRITKIGNTAIEEIIKSINPYVPGENESYKKQWSFPYLLNAELLHYKKIIDNSNEAEFTFQDLSGVEIKKKMKPVLSPVYLGWFRKTLNHDDISRKNRLDKNYWFEYIDSTKTIFFQLNQLADQEGQLSLKSFTKQLSDFVAGNDIDHFVVDVRNCNGGDNRLMVPLVNWIVTDPKINQPGKLHVLIGRQTFSAGISFISALERNTAVQFIGEPTGSGPNQCGDVQSFILPNSKLMIQISARYHQQSMGKDRRLQIDPTQRISYSFENWKRGIDPALKLIGTYDVKSIAEELKLDSANYPAYTGRYGFDHDKILTVQTSKDGLRFEINDFNLFSIGNLYPVSRTVFNTENTQLLFQFMDIQNNQYQKIILNWGSGRDTIFRLPPSYFSPAELMIQGKVDEAVQSYLLGIRGGIIYPATTEAALNQSGYQYSMENKLDEAIKIFKLNTALFPFSGNTWDSLAEMWLKKGDHEKAKVFYLKSLEFNPENEGARIKLKELE